MYVKLLKLLAILGVFKVLSNVNLFPRYGLKTSGLANQIRLTLTTPKRLKSQKGIFVCCI